MCLMGRIEVRVHCPAHGMLHAPRPTETLSACPPSSSPHSCHDRMFCRYSLAACSSDGCHPSGRQRTSPLFGCSGIGTARRARRETAVLQLRMASLIQADVALHGGSCAGCAEGHERVDPTARAVQVSRAGGGRCIPGCARMRPQMLDFIGRVCLYCSMRCCSRSDP